jgi:murein DD-endopeptidase MepM/ murein hydrolase activator NlpD
VGNKWATVLVIGGLLGGVVSPYVVSANAELDKVNAQIRQVQQQQKEAQQKKTQLTQQINEVRAQQNALESDIKTLDDKISQVEEKQEKLNQQIGKTKWEAQQAAQELGDAEERVAKRDELLKTRVRLMYENGEVSYLAVLLSADSFGDFLARFDALKTITEQDHRILLENKQDRDTIAKKKAEIDNHLNQLKGLFAEAEKLQTELETIKKDKKVKIAALKEKEGDLTEFSEEETAQLMALAKQMQQLLAEKNRLTQKDKPVYSGGKFAWPLAVSGTITSPFGYRKDPFTGKAAGHDGVDIAAPQGTTIVAAADGTVLVSGWVNGYGNTVIIDHGNDLWTLYGHIRNGGLKVKVGETVQRGQKIAEVGSTGRSTGPHVHFQVTKNGTPVNPMPYLK